MFAVPSVAQSPSALMLSPSVLSGATAVSAVSTRQTAVAAPAPLSDGSTGQYAQDNAQASQSEASAQFLTQAIAQQETTDSTVMLATDDQRVAPAPEYNVFVSYSFIKYKPSDAGIPQLSLPLPSAAEDAATPPSAAAAGVYQAYANTQSRNRTNLFGQNARLRIAG